MAAFVARATRLAVAIPVQQKQEAGLACGPVGPSLDSPPRTLLLLLLCSCAPLLQEARASSSVMDDSNHKVWKSKQSDQRQFWEYTSSERMIQATDLPLVPIATQEIRPLLSRKLLTTEAKSLHHKSINKS